MVELGYNYRLTDIGAALGLAQLERLEALLARRRRLAARYLERLAGHPGIELPGVDPRADPSWHFMFAQLRLDRLTVDRGAVYHALRAEGIGVNVHYIPVHQHPYYRGALPGALVPRGGGRLRAAADAAPPRGDDRRGRRRRRRGARQGDRGVHGGESEGRAGAPAPAPAPTPAVLGGSGRGGPGEAPAPPAGRVSRRAPAPAPAPAGSWAAPSPPPPQRPPPPGGAARGRSRAPPGPAPPTRPRGLFHLAAPPGSSGFPGPFPAVPPPPPSPPPSASSSASFGTMLVGASGPPPLWAAILVTLLAARIFVYLPPFEAFQALVFVWSVEALAERIPLSVPAMAVIGGTLAGAATLGKVNIGIFAVLMGMVTIACISRPWWRGLVIFLVTTAASGIVLFLATGGHPADLVAYASGVYQIISGYNEAMGGDVGPKRTWLFLALPAVAAILVWIGWRSSRDWPRRRRIGLALLGLVFGFAMWKTAVVREHATFVLSTSVVALFAFTPHVERRTWLLAVLTVGIAFAGSSAIEPRIYLDVVGSTRSLYNEVKDSFLPGRVDRRPPARATSCAASTGSNPRRSPPSAARPCTSTRT